MASINCTNFGVGFDMVLLDIFEKDGNSAQMRLHSATHTIPHQSFVRLWNKHRNVECVNPSDMFTFTVRNSGTSNIFAKISLIIQTSKAFAIKVYISLQKTKL
jgi:hypothetical protein